MSSERLLPLHRTNFSVLDREFSSNRDKFDQEMKLMEEEMNLFRSQLCKHEMLIQGHTTATGTDGQTTNRSEVRTWLDGLNSPLIQDSADGKKLKLRFNVSQYQPEEIVVKTVDNMLQVQAEHEEKTDPKSVYLKYNREFPLPKGTNLEMIKSSLSTDGVLTVEVFMAKNNVRVELKKLEETLQNAINAIKYDSITNEDAEIKYDFISSIINFIKQNTDHIQSNTLKSLILLIGASGAGKSTLLNYLHSPNNLIVSKNEGKLEVKDKDTSIAEIGDGKGSTTLFPNVWSSSFGSFLDCPGEGDTRGIIAEVVDSIYKSKVSNNVEQVKILFVAPQASLGSEGSYGMSFKTALDKNAQFLRDIQYFKNSMAFVITSASIRKTALENSVELINIILNEHANLSAYKDTVTHVISSKNIRTFSKQSEDWDFGDPYFPPSWNPNQREKIIEMIKKLPFTSIPHKDFFNISTSSNVREAMSESLKIVEMKAGLLLKDLVEKASPFTIFAVELKPFVKYLNGLMNCCNTTTLSKYIKILAWNNYLKIKPNQEFINKLNDEIRFLSQFNKGLNEDKNQVIEKDWTKTADLIEILTTTFNNTYSIISCPGNNFSKWVTQGNVTVKPSSSYANNILTNFKSLYKNYEKQKEIDLLGKDQNSTYFDTKTIKVFSRNEAVPFKEMVSYESTEYYEEDEPYCVAEKRTVKETSWRPVTKIKEEAYTEQTPITRYKVEEYEVQEPSPGRSIAFGILTLGITALARGGQFTDTVIKTREVPYTEYVPREKTRQVTYQDIETYEKDVIKYTPVAKTRTVTKCRPTIKEKEVEKIQEPVYKDEVIKEFNSKKHDEDTKGIDDQISKYRKLIVDSINMYPKAEKLGDHNKDSITSIDELEKKYEDLQKLWQEAEYEAYFAQNPNNSLSEELDIHTMGNGV